MASIFLLSKTLICISVLLLPVRCQQTAPASIVLAPSSTLVPVPITTGATALPIETSATLSLSQTTGSTTITNPSRTASATVSGSLASCTIAFDYRLNFDFVNQYAAAQQQIFYYIPRAVSYALNLTTSEEVLTDTLVGLSSSSLPFNTTTVILQVASDLADRLAYQISGKNSWLYQRGLLQDNMATIIAHFDTSWPLQNGPAVILAPSNFASSSSASLSTRSSSTVQSTTTSFSLSTPTDLPQSGSMPEDNKAAIAAGVSSAGALCMVAFVVYLLWRQRRKNRADRLEKGGSDTDSDRYPNDINSIGELGAAGVPDELDSYMIRPELYSNSRASRLRAN